MHSQTHYRDQAGAGALLMDGDGATVEELKQFLGTATNNVAEYRGLILGLEAAVRHQACHTSIASSLSR